LFALLLVFLAGPLEAQRKSAPNLFAYSSVLLKGNRVARLTNAYGDAIDQGFGRTELPISTSSLRVCRLRR